MKTRIFQVVALCVPLGCGGSKDVTPPPAGDTTAPTVTATTPTNSAIDVALTGNVSITFSEPINPATLTTSTVTVASSVGGFSTPLSGTVTFTGTTGTFTPISPLAGSTRYTVTITTAVKDLAGNALASDYVWSFTTIAPPDVTPPTVVSTTPLNDAVNVAVTLAPTVTMSEVMSAATFNASTIVLTKSGDVTPIVGAVTVNGNTATFQPTSALTAATKYTMTVTTGAKDLAGNALAAAASWSFTTAPPPAPEMWRSTAGVFVTKPVVDAAGQLLLQNSLDNFGALDVTTGVVSWTIAQPYLQLPSFASGSVFAINGTFVDPVTGARLWTPVNPYIGGPEDMLVIGGTIVMWNFGDTTLVGFDRKTGREKWRSRLGPLNCQGADFCNFLLPIGVDGANGYVLRRSSNEAQLITLSEDGIVREVVAAGNMVRRVTRTRQASVLQGAPVTVFWTIDGAAAAIDVVTGAERWRLDLGTVAAGFTSNPSDKSFYTPDGALLFAQFDGFSEAQAVLQVVVNTTTGAVLNRRVLTRAEYGYTSWSRCGNAGLVLVTPTGFDYTNLRTGARTDVVRTGLYDAILADFVSEMYPVGTDRVLLTRGFGNAPMIGVKCTP